MKVILAAGYSLEVHAYKLDIHFNIEKSPALSKLTWKEGDKLVSKSIDYSHFSKDNSISLASNRFDEQEVKVETWDLAELSHDYEKYDPNCLYQNGPLFCTECKPGYFLSYGIGQNRCTNTDLDHYITYVITSIKMKSIDFYSYSDHCLKKESSCSKCDSLDKKICDECVQGYILVDGKC